MVIRFLCPNGHKIHCWDDWAGKPAKCPKCGVKFRVPDLSEPEDTGPAALGDGAASVDASLLGSGTASVLNGQSFEFLCPNGHLLHGSRALEGQPGECPECGATFRVPSWDQVPEQREEEPVLEGSLVPAADGEVPAVGGSDSELAVPDDGARTEDRGSDLPAAFAAPSTARVAACEWLEGRAAAHPLAEVFAGLWAHKAQGAAIELHFRDGQTIVPDRYAEALSHGSVGVFAVKDPDGTHTLAAVAWGSVSRVMVRGVVELPGEFRE